MSKPDKHRLEKAREKLMKSLTLESLRKIPKYRYLNKVQYLMLIDKLEELGLFILESYIFTKNDTS